VSPLIEIYRYHTKIATQTLAKSLLFGVSVHSVVLFVIPDLLSRETAAVGETKSNLNMLEEKLR